ncbi:MAG: hypothetical protein JWR61_2129 [Ferruginibacter sp.]|uniref:DUF4268 domain-containing protein n=1 Tax=Ferruginibacter sp. TaxID=1940288 RepID=UPI002658C256|nr:DUF4268 domain-containing protein [Ferruginibacter sp.]MDB5277174.1 hypothetical protein [Ferruginibacter sp.]
MNSKQQPGLVRQQFWTVFGQYMRPVLSASGEKINWINYKTGVKFIRINLNCSNGEASIGLELSNPEEIRHLQFDKLLQFKKPFQQLCGADWQWQKDILSDGEKCSSTISASISNVHILNQSDWSQLISFFKNGMIALDQFWNEYQFALQ